MDGGKSETWALASAGLGAQAKPGQGQANAGTEYTYDHVLGESLKEHAESNDTGFTGATRWNAHTTGSAPDASRAADAAGAPRYVTKRRRTGAWPAPPPPHSAHEAIGARASAPSTACTSSGPLPHAAGASASALLQPAATTATTEYATTPGSPVTGTSHGGDAPPCNSDPSPQPQPLALRLVNVELSQLPSVVRIIRLAGLLGGCMPLVLIESAGSSETGAPPPLPPPPPPGCVRKLYQFPDGRVVPAGEERIGAEGTGGVAAASGGLLGAALAAAAGAAIAAASTGQAGAVAGTSTDLEDSVEGRRAERSG